MSEHQPFINPHLTRPQGEVAFASQSQTFPGMAHFAATGPTGRTCRECSFWTIKPDMISQSYRRDEGGYLLPRRCRKYVTLMRRADPDIDAGPGVPSDAVACHHFELTEKAPAPLSRKAAKALEAAE